MSRYATMLRRTFLHIPGIGPGGERRLWRDGLADWPSAQRAVASDDGGLTPRMRARLAEYLPRSQAALAADDCDHFARLSRFGEAWRLYGDFARSCLFLDIETNGAYGDEEALTVVGVSDGSTYEAYIADQNLEALSDRVAAARVLVTFNGASFDVPALRRMFRRCRLPRAHIDLRFAAPKAGLKGGLKRIEAALGLERRPDLRGLDGWDAVRLWWEYRRGCEGALEQLIAYNRADVEHLKPLMEWVYARLAANTAAAAAE